MTKVAQLMRQNKMTISDLMRSSGLAINTCRSAVNKDTWPDDGVNIGTLRRIAVALGVSVTDLLRDDDLQKGGEPAKT